MRQHLQRVGVAGKAALRTAASAVALLALAAGLHAQTATVVGIPANFDAINDTGDVAHGFEIEADGITSADVTRIFGSNFLQAGGPCLIRYCVGTMTDFPGGVYIRWTSPWDPNTQQFTLGTPLPNGTVATGESCWTIGLGVRYPAAGCEHFGISTIRNPTRTIYRWLVADPNNPGQLMRFAGTPVAIPHPVVQVIPPAQVGGQPAVAFDVQLPPPPPAPVAQWSDAKWVKVYKTELAREVDLNDLLAGNPAVQ